MGDYEQSLGMLERELQGVRDAFASLSDDDWSSPTFLEPFEAGRPHWTVFELAGHFDISIGLPALGVYEYAYTMVEGKKPPDMPDVLSETFAKTITESRAAPRHCRVRLLRAHAPGRVRRQPDRRGRRPRDRPDRRHRSRIHRDARGDRVHGVIPRRVAGVTDRGRSSC
jgi:hypothetical protein